MRISDWSSDVCSSDLAVVDAGFALVADPAQGVLLPLRVVALGEVLARMGAARLLAVLGGDDGGQRLAEQVLQLEGLDQVGVSDPRAVADLDGGERGDRKSVVEGTSVSVRVDIGGGRIMKKNSRANNYDGITS